MKVILIDQPRFDSLQDQVQATVTGKLSADGIFYADDPMLKCPARYEEITLV
ncbi:MAG: cytochrome c maturation protein CcmE [Anaerolineae bacterium]|nr:cytochrome c maturation protein CcmE [Anaerolineae bacterium]